MNYPALCRELTAWRHDPETAFLQEPPTHPLQQTLKALTGAYRHFFEKRSKYPRFKKRGKHDSFRFPDASQYKLDQTNSRIFLPKIGWLRYRNSRNVIGKLRHLTVSRTAGKWYIFILTEHDVAVPRHPSDSAVGIDMGVAMFATLSNGTSYAPVNSYRRLEKKLICCQRALARKTRLSANWRKEQFRIQRINSKIAFIRSDYLHKTSTQIANSHSVVVIEDLSVHSMASSNVRRVKWSNVSRATMAGVNKAILDQGWSTFRSHLEFKQQWRGGRIITISPADTSRKCSVCGFTAAANRTTQAVFTCMQCGHTENADLNAAKNILAAGHAVTACEANGAVKPSAAGTYRSGLSNTAAGISDASERMSKGNASVYPTQRRLFQEVVTTIPKRKPTGRTLLKKKTIARNKLKQRKLWNPADYDDEPRSSEKSALDLFSDSCKAADEQRGCLEVQLEEDSA